MTDEEIEKALYEADDIAINDDVDCCDVLEYINRLKEACQSAIESFTQMETLYKVKCTELDCKQDQIRKETAKEILTDLYKLAHNQTNYPVIGDGDIAIYARNNYGVEVME